MPVGAPAAGVTALSGLVEALAGAYTQLNQEIGELTELNAVISALREQLDATTLEYRERLARLTDAHKQIPDKELRDLLAASLAPLRQRPAATAGTDQRVSSAPAAKRPAPPAAKRTRPARKKAAVPVGSAVVRAWAQENGIRVSARGRVATDVITAYHQANS